MPLKNQLYRLALRITLDDAEAEDIVQETLIKVWNQRDRWNGIENMPAFCFTICRNLSLDSIKRQANQHQSLDNTPVEHADNTITPSEKNHPARPSELGTAHRGQPAREATQLHTTTRLRGQNLQRHRRNSRNIRRTGQGEHFLGTPNHQTKISRFGRLRTMKTMPTS